MAVTNPDGSIILETSVDTSGISEGLNEATGRTHTLKNAVKTAGKTFAVLGASAIAGLGAIGKGAVEAYAEYEQLVGGVDTLFKENSGKLQGYAAEAYKTAGLSANAYMETVTGFSASLLQSLGGDTEKAADYANQALIDMSDNANKMGTSMESIQFAYQGFAKQNYTMLDNLKLGYGGTKEEMQRLLEDATAISGIEYDISSFGDVTQAIHVIQTELGITGTTAKEASTTIQGSAGAMKSAWQNLMVGIADSNQDFDKLLADLISTASDLFKNLLPRIDIVVEGLVQLINELVPLLPDLFQTLLPTILEGAWTLLKGLIAILPELIVSLTTSLIGLLKIMLTDLWGVAKDFWGKNIKPWFTIEKWKELAGKIGTGLKQGFVAAINGIISIVERGANFIVGKLNLLSFDVPDWVPGIGGKVFGFNLSPVSIPRLARGGVIPPNKPQAVIVGDQTSGVNVESPLSTIEEAVENVLARRGSSENSTVILQIDGREFGRAVVKLGGQETRRVGGKLVLA